MHKPPHNKQLSEATNKAAALASEEPKPGSEAWLESKGWRLAGLHECPTPYRRWADPRTGGATAWFYSFTEAVTLQKQRDGLIQTTW